MSAPIIKHVNDKLKPASPGITLAVLLLWGWQTDYLLYAIVMGVLLELPYFIKWRIDFSDKDMNQLTDLSGIIFFSVIVYIFINNSFHGIYKVLELLPFALLIIMLAQNYSVKNSIKTSALFLSIRRLGDKADANILYSTNISLPYVFVCLISASSGYKYDEYFFLSSCIIIAWILWNLRAKHYSIAQWIIPFICVICLSYLTQQGIKHLQGEVESLFLTLFEQYGFKSRNSSRTITYIGSLGRLKLSDRIVLRLRSDKKLITPLYFGEASYSKYEHGTWRNTNVKYDLVSKTPQKNEWLFDKQSKSTGSYNIALYLQDQSTLIPAPKNMSGLTSNDISKVETSLNGATKIEAKEGLISYKLAYSNTKTNETKPVYDDLEIPLNYKNDFKQVAQELGLYTKSPDLVVTTIARYFNDNFYYSVTQNQLYTKGQYLTKFLFKDKKGHCEYFATATALLLREAGIPARYTIGYSVQEYSTWQKTYLVRARHAHSWVDYYMDGEWHTFDTTPSTWAPMEAEDSTFFEPIIDLFSWLRFKLTGIELKKGEGSNDWMFWLLIPLGIYLAWRIYNTDRIDTKNSKNIKSKHDIAQFGNDSPIYPLIKKLEQESDKRLPGETLSNWIKRILPDEKSKKYIELIKLHNRYRFNPASNKLKDKERLKTSLDLIT